MQKTITREIRSKEITCSCNFPMPSSFFFQMKGKFMASFLSHHSDESLDRFSYFSSSLAYTKSGNGGFPRASLLRRIGEKMKGRNPSLVESTSSPPFYPSPCLVTCAHRGKLKYSLSSFLSPSLVFFSLASHVLVI